MERRFKVIDVPQYLVSYLRKTHKFEVKFGVKAAFAVKFEVKNLGYEWMLLHGFRFRNGFVQEVVPVRSVYCPACVASHLLWNVLLCALAQLMLRRRNVSEYFHL